MISTTVRRAIVGFAAASTLAFATAPFVSAASTAPERSAEHGYVDAAVMFFNQADDDKAYAQSLGCSRAAAVARSTSSALAPSSATALG